MEMDKEQIEYEVVDLEILKDLVVRKPDRGHRSMTWAEAYEQANNLPEPEQSQRLKLLDKWQQE